MIVSMMMASFFVFTAPIPCSNNLIVNQTPLVPDFIEFLLEANGIKCFFIKQTYSGAPIALVITDGHDLDLYAREFGGEITLNSGFGFYFPDTTVSHALITKNMLGISQIVHLAIVMGPHCDCNYLWGISNIPNAEVYTIGKYKGQAQDLELKNDFSYYYTYVNYHVHYVDIRLKRSIADTLTIYLGDRTISPMDSVFEPIKAGSGFSFSFRPKNATDQYISVRSFSSSVRSSGVHAIFSRKSKSVGLNETTSAKINDLPEPFQKYLRIPVLFLALWMTARLFFILRRRSFFQRVDKCKYSLPELQSNSIFEISPESQDGAKACFGAVLEIVTFVVNFVCWIFASCCASEEEILE
jgi:hypothetical protein